MSSAGSSHPRFLVSNDGISGDGGSGYRCGGTRPPDLVERSFLEKLNARGRFAKTGTEKGEWLARDPGVANRRPRRFLAYPALMGVGLEGHYDDPA